MRKIDTFSANSLKLLDKSKDEFLDKYLYNLSLIKRDNRARLGEKFHSLICTFIKGVDVSKIIPDLDAKERLIWNNLKTLLFEKRENFIKTEYPFLIKEDFYFLTGRFDAIYKDEEGFIIYDWKTLNLPREADSDLQSVVYLYALSKIYNTEKIKMRYLSIEKLEFLDVQFKNALEYKKRIDEIVKKVL